MSQRIPRVLYHYCSLPTFKSIFDNRCIWLSDIRKSNDSLELQWIMGQCQYYMLKTWVNYVHSVQNERGEGIVDVHHFEEFDRIYKLAKNYDAENDTKNWVFCLSAKADDLGQWRGYADDGKGISIGFNSAILKKINHIGDAIRTISADFRFDQVCYSKNDIDSFFYDKAGFSEITPDTYPNDVIQYMKRAVGLSYFYAPLYKNEKFKEEKEWRIFYSLYGEDLILGRKVPGIPSEDNSFANELTLEKYAFSLRNNTLVSHLELGLPQIKRAINNIIIGPKSNLTPMDIKLYLLSIGVLDNVNDKSIEINRSAISYR